VNPIRTLIVDDDFYAREALRSLLARDSRTRMWADASDVAEAVGSIESVPAGQPGPDVVLLEYASTTTSMPASMGCPYARHACQTPESS
jgi:DNA-binding NarL/FixJ family response regulator